MPGQIRTVELGVNPLRSKAFNRQWIYTQIDQHLSQLIYTLFNPIWPVINARSNSTSRIGCKSIEIDAGNSLRLHCVPAWSNWVSSQWIRLASISMDLHPIRPFEFDWALITGQIGVISMNFYPSSQWKINTKLHNRSEVDLASKWPVLLNYYISVFKVNFHDMSTDWSITVLKKGKIKHTH